MFALRGSIHESNEYITEEDCFKYVYGAKYFTPLNMDKETGELKKKQYTEDILNNDLFPHCHTKIQKIYFLGQMANKLIKTSLHWNKQDERDSYVNKRIDITGISLNNLFRNYFNKLVKDMQKQIVKEIKTGSWKSKNDYKNIINQTNIYKIVKSTTIENGIKRALSTGDFGLKNMNSNKVGVAQVLNRLTYISALSHLRRVNTPIDKSGKLIPPRKLHNSSWGFICPSETPEGAAVGVVKNLSYLTHVTVDSDNELIYDLVKSKIIELGKKEPNFYDRKVKVIINGIWFGITNEPKKLFTEIERKEIFWSY